MSISAPHAEVHAEAMLRTAESCDDYINDPTHAPRSGLNSASPGEWLTLACLSGDIWGPETELTLEARAAVESYRFTHRMHTVRYPVIETGEGIEFETIEPRSLTIGTQRPAASVVYTPEDKPRRKAKAKIRRTTEHTEVYRYRRVSEQELEDLYSRYLAGNEDGSAVLDAVENFVQRLAAWGNSEYKLRMRGEQDDAISACLLPLHSAVLQKRPADGKFAHYVNRSWCNAGNRRYNAMNRRDAQFITTGFDGPDFAAVDDLGELRRIREREQQAHDILAGLRTKADAGCAQSQTALAMCVDIMNGVPQKETAVRLKLSRDQHYRMRKAIEREWNASNEQAVGEIA